MQSQAVTIQDTSFTIPAPYSEGHTLTPNEAAALNQLFAENIRNNFAAKMKKAKEEGKTLGQSDLDAYAASYEFGVRSGGGPKLDPVEREARALAGDEVKKLLRSKGLKLAELPEGRFDALVDQALAKFPALRERAKQIVAVRTSAVAQVDLDLG